METRQFKTTINCGNCIRAVTPALNQEVGAGNWQVDTASPDKILTVTKANIDTATLMAAVQEAGFEIQPA